jgi:hypothetical protein
MKKTANRKELARKRGKKVEKRSLLGEDQRQESQTSSAFHNHSHNTSLCNLSSMSQFLTYLPQFEGVLPKWLVFVCSFNSQPQRFPI